MGLVFCRCHLAVSFEIDMTSSSRVNRGGPNVQYTVELWSLQYSMCGSVIIATVLWCFGTIIQMPCSAFFAQQLCYFSLDAYVEG